MTPRQWNALTHLGDERMYQVWGHWPPTPPQEAPAE